MICASVQNVSGIDTLVAMPTPSDLSTCQNVVMSGSDYMTFINAVTVTSAPYDFVHGGLIFSAFFIPTLSLYLVTRSGAEILRIVRFELQNFFK